MNKFKEIVKDLKYSAAYDDRFWILISFFKAVALLAMAAFISNSHYMNVFLVLCAGIAFSLGFARIDLMHKRKQNERIRTIEETFKEISLSKNKCR